MHVLVVDDNDMNRLLATHVLRDRGWQVTEAAGGLEAITRLDTSDFDLVLLDVSMPHMGGDEVVKWLRADERLESVPVVAYTAHVLPDEIRHLRQIGFDHVITKPVTCEALVGELEPFAARAGG